MKQTEDLIARLDGPAKLDIDIKSDWLLFVSFSRRNHLVRMRTLFVSFQSQTVVGCSAILLLKIMI